MANKKAKIVGKDAVRATEKSRAQKSQPEAKASKRKLSDIDHTTRESQKAAQPKTADLDPSLRGRAFSVSADFEQARGKTGHFTLKKDTLVERVGKEKGLVRVRCIHDARVSGLVPKDVLEEIPAQAFKKRAPPEPSRTDTGHVQQKPTKSTKVNGHDEQQTIDHASDVAKTQSNPTEQDEQAESEEHDTPAPKLNDAERAKARQRYREKLQSFAAARGADGSNGKPVKSRSELMAARKAREERRESRKKQERANANASAKEADSESAESEASRLIGGFGSAGIAGPGASENFTFGLMDTDAERSKGKKRDAKGALAVAEKRERRLAGFDDEKRAQIEDKDAWLAAQRRISGEKNKDNTAMLRKTVKKREKAKKKSGEAWKKRQESVQAGIKARQHRRTENLKKRRPGFEGTFKLAKRHV